MNALVIVESPAKAKTIHKILGKEYTVKASIGHVKDLPSKEIGVDVENNFKPQYVVIPGKEKIIRELRKASRESDMVFLAPDPDREGEAIAWHIATEIADKKSKTLNEKIYRIVFNEITEKAVREAITNPQKIDMRKVEAQQARRILDRLVGYNLSPLLWRKVRRGLSAGRVQSVAVRLIVDRDREINSFVQEEYWSMNAEFEGSKLPQFWARLSKIERGSAAGNLQSEKEQRFLIPNEAAAKEVAGDLRDKTFVLKTIERKQRKRMPYPPFITSTLQQEAARKLKFTAKKTMQIAQQLYEGIELGEEGSVGLITYMRTDSHRLASEAQQWARALIQSAFGKAYVPEKPPVYKSKASAQEAHEAIRPTYADKKPENIKRYLSKDQYALYALIWNRFLSSQMSPAQMEQTTFIIRSIPAIPFLPPGVPGEKEKADSGVIRREFAQGAQESPSYEFRATGTVVRFDGFMALYTEGKDDAEEENGLTLPDLREGEELKLLNLMPKQHFTQPPPRYTEATLVKALEEKGIGRPSTYAAILSTIQERKYVQKAEGKFSPTELGIVVNDYLVERFKELIDDTFTAKMEDELDHIEEGKMEWVKVVQDFYKPFHDDLTKALTTVGKVKPQDIPTDVLCEKCGLPMVKRWGRHGRFLACTGFPDCKNTKPLSQDGDDTNGRQEEQLSQQTDQLCEKCGSPMVIRSGRYGKFLACTRYPECKNTKPFATGIKCPKDSGDIVEKRSRRGKQFWSCSNYPQCTFATWYKPIPRNCPRCGVDFLLEKRNKNGDLILFCHKKECGYKEVEKTQDAEAVGAGVM